MTKQTALITGASSGIGLELARIFAMNNYDLILVSRDAKALNNLKRELENQHPISALVITKDLSASKSCDEVYAAVKKKKLSIDILVNNAGFGSFGQFKDSDINHELSMIEVNISALTHLTRLFLPDMVKRKQGRIMNVASIAGFLPGPLMSVYYATKAYVLSFSEAISEELRGSGVTVTALCPGRTKSGFQKSAGIADNGFFRGNIPTSKEVAEYGYTAMMKGKVIAVHGLQTKLTAQAIRLTPRWIVRRMIKLYHTK